MPDIRSCRQTLKCTVKCSATKRKDLQTKRSRPTRIRSDHSAKVIRVQALLQAAPMFEKMIGFSQRPLAWLVIPAGSDLGQTPCERTELFSATVGRSWWKGVQCGLCVEEFMQCMEGAGMLVQG